jgi:alpha-L-arabinofuranosidase
MHHRPHRRTSNRRVVAAMLALAIGPVALPALSPATSAAATAPAPATSIVVDATHPGAPVAPALFGADYLAPFGGMGSFDASTGTFWPSFVGQVRSVVAPGSLRFPGGIAAEAYDWERAIGPQAQRTDNPIGPSNGPSPSTVGPDEFGRLLDLTGASGVVTVNFGTGSAQEAADFVSYMTGRVGTSVWADRRARDGHPAPYDVPDWEVGNEEYSPDYWRTGTPVTVNGPPGACATVPTCLYIYGGSTSFTDQDVVGYADRSAAAAVSGGAAGQSFYVAYPPVSPGSATIDVGGQPWTEVASLDGAGSSDDVYTLDPSTGEITFGDGVHGATPPAGATVTASYVSGPHDGFEQFYRAMKQVNPNVQVCSSDTSNNFIAAMGSSLPYDCLQDHPYVGSSDASPSLPIDQYETQVMGAPDTEATAVQSLESTASQAAGHPVPLVLSEYGQLINATPDPVQDPYYLDSLDEALVNASQLAAWIRLGVPVADRQLLDAEQPDAADVTHGLPGAAPFAVTGAIVTPGPQTIAEPTAQYLGLMRPLAGGRLLTARTNGDPQLTTADGAPVGDLSVVAAAGGGGIDVVAINRNPSDDVSSTLSLAGTKLSGRVTVATLDGPSALSDNTSDAPDTVHTTSSTVRMIGGDATLTLPAHSISLVRIGGG